MTLADNLRIYRRRKGIDAQTLAAQAGISKGYMSSLETGRVITPSYAVVASLAEALGVTTDELCSEEPVVPETRCRHYGVQWVDPIGQTAIECVTCGRRWVVGDQP